MKIALLGPAHPYRGGIVHFNSRLIKELNLSEISYDAYFWSKLYPSIFLPKSEKEFMDQKSKNKFLHQGKTLLNYSNPFSWLYLVFLLIKSKPDIFITHWVQLIHFPVFFVVFSLLKLFTKTEIRLIAHNVQSHEKSFIDNLFTKVLFILVDKIVVHSNHEYDNAAKLVKKEKLILAYHPIYDIFPVTSDFDIEKFKSSLKLRKKVVLFFGFIRPYKGLEYLIEAFSKISKKRNDISLLIVGELFWKVNKDKKTFWSKVKMMPFLILSMMFMKKKISQYNPLTLINKYHLHNSVVVVDHYVSNDEVFKYFLASDVLAAPYLTATQSGPVQIAYSFNKPIIASKIGGLCDILEDNYSGYFVDAANASDLQSKIEKFFDEGKVNNENIISYKQKFSWERYVSLISLK